MNDHSSVDRETFQQLLASAYAVQESQINRQSLSAILDIQRSIASGKLDLDGAMHFIVESARDVAKASGVAIGLLKGDRLTYRAGSGTSAAFVGQHVTASLTVSAFTRTNREILRVEDAENDTRIEADICRQFGANSLLMLPIYFDHGVAGILDIRFNQAHAFQEREVRAYRLMAEQIECALSHSVQHQPHDVAPDLTVDDAIPEEVLLEQEQEEDLENAPRFWMGESSVPSFFERCQTSLTSAKESPAFQRSVALGTILAQRVKSFPADQREKYFLQKQKTKRFLSSSRIRHYVNLQRVTYLTRAKRVQLCDEPPSPPHSGVGIGCRAGRFHRTHCLQAPHSRILVRVLHAAEIYGARPAGNRRQASSRQNCRRAGTHARESRQWKSRPQAPATCRE